MVSVSSMIFPQLVSVMPLLFRCGQIFQGGAPRPPHPLPGRDPSLDTRARVLPPAEILVVFLLTSTDPSALVSASLRILKPPVLVPVGGLT